MGRAFLLGVFLITVSAFALAQKLPSGIAKEALDSAKKTSIIVKDASPKLKKAASKGIKSLADSSVKQFSSKVSTYKSALSDKGKLPADSTLKSKAASYGESKLNALGLPLSKGSKASERKLNFFIENSSLYLSNSPSKSGSAWFNNLSFGSLLSVGKLPLNINVSSNYSSDNGFEPLQSNLFKFGFDRDLLVNSVRDDVQRMAEFKKEFLNGLELPEFTSQALSQKLSKVEGAKAFVSSQQLRSFIGDKDNLNQLLKLDKRQVEARVEEFINENKELLSAESEKAAVIKTELLEKASTISESTKTNVVAAIKKNQVPSSLGETMSLNVLRAKLIDSISSVVSNLRSTLAENGLDADKIQLVQSIVSGEVNIADVEKVVFGELDKEASGSKFHSYLYKLREIQTGAFAEKVPGNFLNNDIFMKGASVSIGTRRGPVSLGIGRQNDAASSKDLEFQNSVFTSNRIVSFLTVPTFKSLFGSGKLSWSGSFSRQDEQSAFNSAVMGRNSMAFTITQSLNTNKIGKFTVDVSKSASQYNNTLSPGSEHLMLDKHALSNYFNDDLFETISVGLNHEAESRRSNLSSNFYFNYAGVGFQNPGAMGGSNMKMRLGGNLRKKLYNNKVSLNLRTDYKNTPISFSSGAHWQNLQLQFDTRVKAGKKLNLNFKYLDNGMSRVSGSSTPVYSSRKLQLGASSSYKIAGKYFFSNITLAGQQVANHQLLAGNSQFITLNYLQSLVLKGANLSSNLFYNKETGSTKLIGDMLNGDFSCQFRLLKVNLTSSLTYLANASLARQLGIKQNVQILAGKHFDVNGYLDLRKNLIQPLFPDLYASGRGEISVKYYLNNRF